MYLIRDSYDWTFRYQNTAAHYWGTKMFYPEYSFTRDWIVQEIVY